MYNSPLFLRWSLLLSPLGFIAVISGWFTTETGRQPWIVYGLMRTHDAASILPAASVFSSLSIFILLYILLLSIFIWYFLQLIRTGPQTMPYDQSPNKLTAWLEDKK